MGQVLNLVERDNDNGILWYFRANSARTGSGSWTETPQVLQRYVKQTILNLMRNPVWLYAQVYLKSCYLRTWSPAAMYRALVLVAGATALSSAAFILKETHDH